MKKKIKALFLDRDGVINKNYGYVFSMKNFAWLKNAKEAIRYAYVKKYLIIIITNQSGVARGLYSENDIKKLHYEINKQLKKKKIAKSTIFFIALIILNMETKNIKESVI